MNTLVGWIVFWIVMALIIAGAAYILPGVRVRNFWTALIVAVVLGLVNLVIRPFLLILTLPINILTLGLFTIVINALMVMLTSAIVPNFKVNGFINALLFSVIISIFRIILAAFISV